MGLPAGGFGEIAGPKSDKEWRPKRPRRPEEAHLLQVRRPMPHRRIEKRMSTSSGNGLGLPAGGSVEIAGPKSYIEAQKAKMQGNAGPIRPKAKEMKAHKAKNCKMSRAWRC